MRKLTLAAIAMYVGILGAFSQARSSADSTSYKPKKLSLEEVNFVSGYYRQNGNNSAVTGGIGSEKLNDFANTFDVRWSRYDKKQRKHTIDAEVGVDHYTSASSDKIDPNTISSPSYSDTRFYPSVTYQLENAKKYSSVGLTASYSTEYDYQSIGMAASFSKGFNNNNTSFAAKLQAFFDTWSVIYPVELRRVYGGYRSERGIAGTEPRNSYSASLSLSQIVNKKLQMVLVAEPAYQAGLLATRYQRVYFAGGGLKSETLPDSRMKLPIGLRANYFFGDQFIVRSFYRYYQDDWGVKAHSLEIEMPIKITPFFSISPFYRYYTQTAADYFAPYAEHKSSDAFFTSDYDLSAFHSSYFGSGFRVAPPTGVFGIQKLNSLEVRYGHYTRSNGLQSDQLSLHVRLR